MPTAIRILIFISPSVHSGFEILGVRRKCGECCRRTEEQSIVRPRRAGNIYGTVFNEVANRG
jgi:hypothetical protein